MKEIIKRLLIQLLPLILEAVEDLVNDLLKKDPVKTLLKINYYALQKKIIQKAITFISWRSHP